MPIMANKVRVKESKAMIPLGCSSSKTGYLKNKSPLSPHLKPALKNSSNGRGVNMRKSGMTPHLKILDHQARAAERKRDLLDKSNITDSASVNRGQRPPWRDIMEKDYSNHNDRYGD
jgi:hypothetical protein